MNDILPQDGARFDLPDEPVVIYEDTEPGPETCSCCGDELEARHICNVCDCCADLMPAKDRKRLRLLNRAPADSGVAKRLILLGAQPWRENLWTVPGVPELLSAREALRHFGPDKLPAIMR